MSVESKNEGIDGYLSKAQFISHLFQHKNRTHVILILDFNTLTVSVSTKPVTIQLIK